MTPPAAERLAGTGPTIAVNGRPVTTVTGASILDAAEGYCDSGDS
jgi:hypothetical protein